VLRFEVGASLSTEGDGGSTAAGMLG